MRGMKKIIVSFFAVGALIVYGVMRSGSAGTKAVLPGEQSSGQSGLSAGAKQINVSYKDGEYIGDSVDVFYGNVQVKAVIQSGKIVSVQFLQYPSDRSESQSISQQATPMLAQEAVSAQSGNVDVVSGATQTSEGFIQSLQSALVKAKV